MTRTTILAHLQLGRSNAAMLSVTRQLMQRWSADVVGIAASQPMLVVSGDGFVCGDVFADDQRHLTADLETVETTFREALRDQRGVVEWRTAITIDTVADYLATQARCADLIVTAATSEDAFDLSHEVNPGTLAMQAGRPVLVVPSGASSLRFAHAVMAWKDTRESRRAAADALPLLQSYARVTVVEVAAVDDVAEATVRVLDVAAWFVRHGITAEGLVATRDGKDGRQLTRLANDAGADLIVAGAFGHSRLREWVMGGVTRDFLSDMECCVLLSH